MDWGSIIAKAFTLGPLIVAGIEAIHGETKSKAEKAQLATQSLTLASGAADTILPSGDDAAVQAWSNVANAIIAAAQFTAEQVPAKTSAAATSSVVPAAAPAPAPQTA